MIGPRVGLSVGGRRGIAVGVGSDELSPAAPSGATRDATSNIYIPQSAAEYVSLGIPAPAHLYLCQEASGNLTDTIGAKTLTKTGTAAFQVAVSGWSTKAVGPDGTASNQFFQNAAMENINATSVAFMCYAIMNQSATGRQCAYHGAASTNAWEGAAGANTMRLRSGANAGNGTLDHTGAVRPFLVVYDRTNSANVIYSDIEKKSITYGASAGATFNLQVGIVGDAAATTRFLHVAIWTGSDAELNDTTAKARLQALAWSVSGY